MRPAFTNRRVLAAVAVLLALMSQVPSRCVRPLSDKPRDLVVALLNPLTHPLKRLSDSLRRRRDLDVKAPLDENRKQALQYMRRLEAELDDARETIAQLTQTRQILGFQSVTLTPASVTASSDHTLTINRGRTAGLRDGLVATAGGNLVGRITHTGPVTATIQLITAPKTLLTTRIVPPVPGEPTRDLSRVPFEAEGEFLTAVVNEDHPVQPGDLAHLDSCTWCPPEARGFVVGKVVKIEPYPDDPTLRRRLVVQPIKSLRHLSEVAVPVPSDGD